MCEGLVLKAPKILKYVTQLELDGWDWLNQFVKTKNSDGSIKPNPKYMAEVLAGRPIFSMPMAVGGFRLRYGRSRLAGLATTAVHPATMVATSGFVSIGTQLKYERPGKGTVVTPCDTIDGPYVEFNDGSARRIQDSSDLELILPNEVGYPIKKVWDLGELLVPVGEFLENNHPLLPSLSMSIFNLWTISLYLADTFTLDPHSETLQSFIKSYISAALTSDKPLGTQRGSIATL